MAKTDALKIAHLTERPDALTVLVDWFIAEWRLWYGPDGAGDAEADLSACIDRNALPICLVALEDDTLVGTIALRRTSLGSELGYAPWLAGLLVPMEHRRRGIATALVAALEREAARLGFDAIYTSTDTADSIMRRRGWEPVGDAQSLRGEVTVFRRTL